MRLIRAALALAALAAAALPALAQTPNSHNSGYFPGGTGLAAANGDLVTVSPASALAGGVLTLPAGGTAGSAVRAAQYEIETPGAGPIATSPYYLSISLPLPGTVQDVRVAGLSASGANLQYVLHLVHAGTDTVVGGLGNVAVCDGESTCAAGTTATYAAPLTTAATGSNTYVAGDQLYVSFNTVGGTFTSFSLHVDVVQ